MAKAPVNEARFVAAQGNLNAFLDKGSAFEGKLTFQGAVRIDGKFTGDALSDDKLLVGETGRIFGNVTVGDADVGGSIEGTLTVLGVAHLRATARIKGEIHTARLVVEDGATINGTINMTMPDPSARAKELQDEVEKTLA